MQDVYYQQYLVHGFMKSWGTPFSLSLLYALLSLATSCLPWSRHAETALLILPGDQGPFCGIAGSRQQAGRGIVVEPKQRRSMHRKQCLVHLKESASLNPEVHMYIHVYSIIHTCTFTRVIHIHIQFHSNRSNKQNSGRGLAWTCTTCRCRTCSWSIFGGFQK